MKSPIISLVAASLAITATPAIAGEGKQRITVQHQDLNLATEAGVDRLERRINSAAKQVCGTNDSRIAPQVRAQINRCMVKARATAQQQFASVIEQQRLGG